MPEPQTPFIRTHEIENPLRNEASPFRLQVFQKLNHLCRGFVRYNGELEVNSSLLNVVLHD
jgi:hypothetical protein